MGRYENALSTLQVRTIISAVGLLDVDFTDKYIIEEHAFSVVESLQKAFPEDFPIILSRRFVACALAACAKKGVQTGALPVAEYIGILSATKQDNETNLYDFGAFGDLYEVLIRCALVKVTNFFRCTTLYVKPMGETDIVSKKYGKLEVGHNGKTFTFGTLFDYMAGDYTGIIYGVFSKEDKMEIYRLCQEHEFQKAVDYVTSYSALWVDKYEFQKDIDNLSRGKGITKKSGCIQVVFNESKYNAFVNALANGTIKSLYETLHE